jgi:four helix bundle protein
LNVLSFFKNKKKNAYTFVRAFFFLFLKNERTNQMIKGFLAYDLAVELYRECEQLPAKYHVRDQLLRASLSIVLNLAEGSGKPSAKEKRRFYSIAMGSTRETQALLSLLKNDELVIRSDRIGGMIYRLVHPKNNTK